MRCLVCKRPLSDGQRVIPVARVVGNSHRGDFIGNASEFIHLDHLIGVL